MSAETVLNEVSDRVNEIVPASVEITEIEFEGSVVVIYTKSMEEYAKLYQLWGEVRKRNIGEVRRIVMKHRPVNIGPMMPSGAIDLMQELIDGLNDAIADHERKKNKKCCATGGKK